MDDKKDNQKNKQYKIEKRLPYIIKFIILLFVATVSAIMSDNTFSMIVNGLTFNATLLIDGYFLYLKSKKIGDDTYMISTLALWIFLIVLVACNVAALISVVKMHEDINKWLIMGILVLGSVLVTIGEVAGALLSDD